MIGARAPVSMTASSIMRPSPKGGGRRDHMPLEWSQPLTLTLLVNCAALPAILDVSLHPPMAERVDPSPACGLATPRVFALGLFLCVHLRALMFGCLEKGDHIS